MTMVCQSRYGIYPWNCLFRADVGRPTWSPLLLDRCIWCQFQLKYFILCWKWWCDEWPSHKRWDS